MWDRMWDGIMKRKGPRPDRALTALKIRALKEPGRYGDGNGLYLIVDPSGAKRWILRTIVQGRRRDMGLGSARLVSLADARDEARAHRRIAMAAIPSPRVERRGGSCRRSLKRRGRCMANKL